MGISARLREVQVKPRELSDLVVPREQLLVRHHAFTAIARKAHRVGEERFDGSPGETDEPDGGEDAEDEDYRDEVGLVADRLWTLRAIKPLSIPM